MNILLVTSRCALGSLRHLLHHITVISCNKTNCKAKETIASYLGLLYNPLKQGFLFHNKLEGSAH